MSCEIAETIFDFYHRYMYLAAYGFTEKAKKWSGLALQEGCDRSASTTPWQSSGRGRWKTESEDDPISMESKFYHEHDCVTRGTGKDRFSYFYDQGPIIRVDTDGSYDRYTGELGSATILYRDDSRFSWKSKYVNCVFQGQVGIAVSPDGHFLFLPTWDLGFHCVDAKNGDRIWSKRYGVTNVFVLKNTLVCQRPYKALQLLDLHTGELLHERRVPAWGFTSLNHRYIICHVKETHRDNHWDIIKAATLETVQSIPQRTLTGDHEYACVRDIVWKHEGELLVSGFKDSRGRSKDEFSVRIKCVDLSV